MGPLELVARALVTRLDILDQFQSEKLRTNGGGEKSSRADLRCLLEFVASCLVVYWFPLFDLFIHLWCAVYTLCARCYSTSERKHVLPLFQIISNSKNFGESSFSDLIKFI